MYRDDPTIRRWLRILIRAVSERLDEEESFITVYREESGRVDSMTHGMMDDPVNGRSDITTYNAVRELLNRVLAFMFPRTPEPRVEIRISRYGYSILVGTTLVEEGVLAHLHGRPYMTFDVHGQGSFTTTGTGNAIWWQP